MNCIEVLEQLADYLDEGARADLCEAINEHLEKCPNCRIEVETVRRTITLYRSNEMHVVTPTAISLKLSAALKREYDKNRGPLSD